MFLKQVTSFSGGQGQCHVAFNYWFHPPDNLASSQGFEKPYLSNFFPSLWQSRMQALHGSQSASLLPSGPMAPRTAAVEHETAPKSQPAKRDEKHQKRKKAPSRGASSTGQDSDEPNSSAAGASTSAAADNQPLQEGRKKTKRSVKDTNSRRRSNSDAATQEQQETAQGDDPSDDDAASAVRAGIAGLTPDIVRTLFGQFMEQHLEKEQKKKNKSRWKQAMKRGRRHHFAVTALRRSLKKGG